MSAAVLTLNAGSSSLKFAVFRRQGEQLNAALRGQVEGLGAEPRMSVKDEAGETLAERRWAPGARADYETLLAQALDWIEAHLGRDTLVAVGQRVVHGGSDFRGPVSIEPRVMERLEALVPLAPLHQPHNLAAIRAAQANRPSLPQVACFDTAFHADHADVVTRFALPRRWRDQGVRRYGFHGLSYEYVSGRLAELDPQLAAGRVIIAHLGAGASLCALKAGRSVDTTMGFTALDGLVMGTRSGALDPGVILYLQQQAGLTAEAVSDLLYRRSGLLGVSDISSDMRVLLDSPDPKAREAVDLFVFRVAREACALMAALEGLDGVVFTAGIGENAPEIRAAVAGRLAWLGLNLDEGLNAAGVGRISTSDSRLRAWVVPTNEELMIARHTVSVLEG